jgi:RecJ-like exonuclease
MNKDNICKFCNEFLESIKNKKVHLVSHFDTDGITSAAIISKTLERLEVQFSMKILKGLNSDEILKFPKEKLILLLDLGSSHLEELSRIGNEIFIIDHHELSKEIPPEIHIINPHCSKNFEALCSAELCYCVSKTINEENKDQAPLSIIGMVGDVMEKEINKTRNEIIKDAGVIVKRGLMIYPSTRPLDKTLEFSSRPFIPGVTGDSKGVYELLNESGIEKIGKFYKSLIDLNDDEMQKLTTSVLLRLSSTQKKEDYLGNLFLLKFFNKIEDAREISAIINACSRMDEPEIALMFCLGNSNSRKKAEKIYVKYRQHIISGLKHINENHKIEGKEYVIINAKDKIKDTIIGTMASILSFSSVYKEGTIIIAMAYNGDKIKISTRMAGRNPTSPRNLKQLMESITQTIGGESGGHKHAAGCTIDKSNEEKFIELMKKKLEFEIIKF